MVVAVDTQNRDPPIQAIVPPHDQLETTLPPHQQKGGRESHSPPTLQHHKPLPLDADPDTPHSPIPMTLDPSNLKNSPIPLWLYMDNSDQHSGHGH
jgi:hypothetical protein